MTTQTPKHRVIIAGGSISGLTLALCLQKAKIDFIVLERGIIAPQLGASIGMYPTGNNIMTQLGVYPELKSITYPLVYGKSFDDKGNCLGDSYVYQKMADIYGFPVAFQQRREFIDAIYKQIEDKSKILTHKKVVSYQEGESSVTVQTADGSSYEGTILVGADGVNSAVRNLMADASRKGREGSEKPFETTDTGKSGLGTSYKAIFAITRTDSTTCPMTPGRVWHAYGKGHSSIVASGSPGCLFWFLFVKIQDARGPQIPRYSEKEADAVINQFRDMKMCHEFTIGEAWDARIKGDLFAMEEGIFDQWSRGRVVCIGDAIHKMTINVGFGANCAIEGIAQFSNLLYPVLSPLAPSASPVVSTAKCEEIFSIFRQRHLPRAKLIYEFSALGTRLEAQETLSDYVISRFILPRVGDLTKIQKLHPILKGAPTIDYLPRDMTKGINHPTLTVPENSSAWIMTLSVLCAMSFGFILNAALPSSLLGLVAFATQ